MNIIPYGKQTIDDNDIREVVKVLKSDFLTSGPKVKEFEDALCSYSNSKYAVCVSNATAALHLSSLVLLQPGDKVITTVNSFLATSNSILYAKAKPIFVDIEENGNIDLDKCKELLTRDSSIKALYVVHFSGNPVNQDKLKKLKNNFNIKILEDCAHSIGAKYKNIKAGSCKNSDISVFSFHPVKHLTTGEGGVILTNDKQIYKSVSLLRNHGMHANTEIAPWHYDMVNLGFNYRLSDISCALGLSQLSKLDSFLEKRRSLVKRYENFFLDEKNITPLYKYTCSSSYHLFVVKIDFDKIKISKKEFFLKLKEKNIFLQYHYIPINKQPYYKQLGYGNEKTPIMDDYYKKALSLPLYPKLRDEEQDYVIKNILDLIK